MGKLTGIHFQPIMHNKCQMYPGSVIKSVIDGILMPASVISECTGQVCLPTTRFPRDYDIELLVYEITGGKGLDDLLIDCPLRGVVNIFNTGIKT